MLQAVKRFVQRETVLVVAWVLAVVSMFFVPPDGGYAGYVDMRTLGLLWMLMGVMAAYQSIGLFAWLGRVMSKALGNTRALELTLVLLCFWGSMLITNDAALLTFVPFTTALLTMTGQQKRILFVVVMQTIAANLGSMLLPVGNPQNIYIYSKSGASLGEFVGVIAPYAGISLVLLLIFVLVRKSEPITLGELPENQTAPGKKAVAYDSLLFLLCLLAVFRVLDVKVGFCLVLLGLLVQNRRLIGKVDYALLLTFVGFFIFVGNMGRIPGFSALVSRVLTGQELLVGILSSQVISNVPATLLLYDFTPNWQPLLLGVNIGGLGTLIASMASLISYKQVPAGQKGRYLLQFTLWNLVFLVVLTGAALVLK